MLFVPDTDNEQRQLERPLWSRGAGETPSSYGSIVPANPYAGAVEASLCGRRSGSLSAHQALPASFLGKKPCASTSQGP